MVAAGVDEEIEVQAFRHLIGPISIVRATRGNFCFSWRHNGRPWVELPPSDPMCRQPLPTIAYPAIDGFVVADNYGCAYDRAAPLFSNISK